MRMRFPLLLCTVLALSCEKTTDRITHGIDEAMKAVERVSTPLNENIQEANGILSGVLGDIKKWFLAPRVELTIGDL